ncbi:MAG: hypothetical protein Q4C64_04010 [Erysipelotrichia bacterium]|nr:hypothetical protein [Erysipelotrichia bacterium]
MKIDLDKIRKFKEYWILIAFILCSLPFAKISGSDIETKNISMYYFRGVCPNVFYWGTLLLFVFTSLADKDIKILRFTKNTWVHILISILTIIAYYEMTYKMNDFIYDNIAVQRNIIYYLIYVFLFAYVIMNILEWILLKKKKR